MDGFGRGRKLDKIGMHAQDTAELFFEDVRVPVDEPARRARASGFVHLMHNLPQERLVDRRRRGRRGRAALDTVEYCRERKAFGQQIGSFQNSRFELAEMSTEIDIAQAYVDRCIARRSTPAS